MGIVHGLFSILWYLLYSVFYILSSATTKRKKERIRIRLRHELFSCSEVSIGLPIYLSILSCFSTSRISYNCCNSSSEQADEKKRKKKAYAEVKENAKVK